MTAELRELEAMLTEEESSLAHASDVSSEDGLIRRLFAARRVAHQRRVDALKLAIQSLRSDAQSSSGGGSPTPSDEAARPGPQCAGCPHPKHEGRCGVWAGRSRSFPWAEELTCDCIA